MLARSCDRAQQEASPPCVRSLHACYHPLVHANRPLAIGLSQTERKTAAPRTMVATMLWLSVAATGSAVACGCEQAPAEPEQSTSRPRTVASSRGLLWTAPPAWTVQRLAKRGEYRAKYSVPAQGNGKHPAELLVSHLGNSAAIKTNLDALVSQFEGPTVKQALREQSKIGDFSILWLNVGGTYKFPMGPAVGPGKRHAVHVIKDNWRFLAAGVSTPKRGHWFFRMVGPEDTVQAARSAFRNMIQTVK